MLKKALFSVLLAACSCSRLPLREEVDFRNQLENAIVRTFPNKAVVYLHNFTNKTPNDKDNAYLVQALPDAVEAVMEPLRDNLSFKNFEGMPFYVSLEISNLMQRLAVPTTNTNTAVRVTNNYFSYLTNYLILTQEMITQVEYDVTTNTNYYEVNTNSFFDGGVARTNYISNQILMTTTNSSNDVVTAEDRYILTATNMLLLIVEEFPYLTNYFSYVPIEIVRASEEDDLRLEDILDPRGAESRRKAREKSGAAPADISADKAVLVLISNLQARADRNEPGARAELLRQRKILRDQQAERASGGAVAQSNANVTNTNAANAPPKKEEPKDPETFRYEYHVYGSFSTLRASRVDPLRVNVEMYLSPVYGTGNTWWTNTQKTGPPKISELLALVQSLDTNSPEIFQEMELRLPFRRPPISRRLQDEISAVSTNNYLDRPALPETPPEERRVPLALKRLVLENEISGLVQEWQKYLTAEIINRPYTVLRVDSTPPNALVYMDGIFIGRTPFTYPTAPLGMHRFSFLQDGYSRAELFSEVLGGKTNALAYNLISLDNSGTIKVASSMEGSEVYLNAVFKGIAPVSVSNLSLGQRYRIEVLNPDWAARTNRNSAYLYVTLTKEKPDAVFNAKFKSFETSYRPASQKMLLAATYLSWFTTLGLMGGAIYTYARFNEFRDLANVNPQNRVQYQNASLSYGTASQILLYTSLAGIFVSSGIMGWYLYSKEVYLGFSSPLPNSWYANVSIKF